jgi:hypothetical protein
VRESEARVRFNQSRCRKGPNRLVCMRELGHTRAFDRMRHASLGNAWSGKQEAIHLYCEEHQHAIDAIGRTRRLCTCKDSSMSRHEEHMRQYLFRGMACAWTSSQTFVAFAPSLSHHKASMRQRPNHFLPGNDRPKAKTAAFKGGKGQGEVRREGIAGRGRERVWREGGTG